MCLTESSMLRKLFSHINLWKREVYYTPKLSKFQKQKEIQDLVNQVRRIKEECKSYVDIYEDT